jgi:acyl carrier protein
MDQDVQARVIAEIASVKRIPIERITIDSTFDDLGIDSLDATNLLFVLEEEFGVSIPDADARALRDVRSAIAAVERLQVPKQSA